MMLSHFLAFCCIQSNGCPLPTWADQLLIFDSILHRQGAAAREEAEATLAAAKLQTEGLRQDLAASQAHLTQTRKELHASQGKVDQLEQQCQDLQDQTHQQMAEIKVCMNCPCS